MPIAEGPNEIGGRAYGGDRVACVTTSESEPREVIATALHEVCHCFGLDHCVAWHCLMASLMLPDADGPDGDKDPRGAGYAKLRKGAEPPPGGARRRRKRASRGPKLGTVSSAARGEHGAA